MATQNNEEYLEFLADLAEREFTGELTLYFQGGIIESNRLSERNTRTEIKKKMQARKYRRALTLTRQQ